MLRNALLLSQFKTQPVGIAEASPSWFTYRDESMSWLEEVALSDEDEEDEDLDEDFEDEDDDFEDEEDEEEWDEDDDEDWDDDDEDWEDEGEEDDED